MDGHLLNLNYGEFYVYSPDGVIDGIDTIFVTAGRFNYKTTCERNGTLVIVFPNFSEQPVFAQPGKSVKVSGDVSHLKELKVTGTRDNKLMNLFREQSKEASPDELPAIAKSFIQEHAESIVAIYLVNKYFIRTASPDYVTASALLDTLLAAQPNNGLLAQNAKKLKERASTAVGEKLPPFKAVSIEGDTITQKTFAKSDGVVYLWASYEYESCNIQRSLSKHADSLKLLGICLDASMKDCRRVVERDNIAAPIVCDSMAFDGALVQLLGMTNLPDNIVVENGSIVARGLTAAELRERYDKRE